MQKASGKVAMGASMKGSPATAAGCKMLWAQPLLLPAAAGLGALPDVHQSSCISHQPRMGDAPM